MASGLFDNAREEWLKGTIDWVNDNIDVMLMDDGYTYDSTEEFVGDLTGGEELSTATNYVRKDLAGRSVSVSSNLARVFATDVTWTALGNGANETIGGAIIFVNSGADATSRMLVWLDTSNLLTQGVDVTLDFDGTNGIFTW